MEFSNFESLKAMIDYRALREELCFQAKIVIFISLKGIRFILYKTVIRA